MPKKEIDQQDASADTLLTDLLGIKGDETTKSLVLTPENIAGQITNLAEAAMQEHLVDRRVIEGREFFVSKGCEHFSDVRGELDGAFTSDNPHFFGIRLYREVDKKNQEFRQVFLAQNGNVNHPLATFNPATDVVQDPNTLDPIEDNEKLGKCLEYVGAIKMDSDRVYAEQEQDKKTKYSRGIRKVVGGMIAASGVAITLLVGPTVVEEIQDKIEQTQRENDEENARQRQQEQAEREAREADIREFDASHDIEDVPEYGVATAGLVAASTQFSDVDVPNFEVEDEEVSEELAHDVTNPREFEADLSDGECKIFEDVPFHAGETVSLIHNGGDRREYTFFASNTQDELEICDHGQIGTGNEATGAEADRFVVQVNPGPN